MADRLNVKQINLHHCKSATFLIDKHFHDMQTLQKQNQNLIVLIQEPWINKSKIQGLDENKYNVFYDKNSKRPRACIAASKSLNVVFMPQFSDGDCTTVIVNLTKQSREEIIFSSVYMDGEKNHMIPEQIVRESIEYSVNSGIPIIIAADCNAHHTLWGSSDTNMRGNKLTEFLATTSLEICNVGNSPTFANRIRQEVLDVTFETQSLANRVSNWHVSKEETLSDHREINFFIEHEKDPNVLFRNPRNTN